MSGAEQARAPAAWILSIGNELLVGRIINTNAAYLARRLTFMGFKVTRIITVPDSVDDIAEEISRAKGRAGVVVTTGGLGPTYDDVTLEGIAKALGLDLEVNSEALRMVEEFYSRRGLPLTPERVKMAMLPRGAKPLPNPVGAAPGVVVEDKSVLVVALPGVPAEMKAIFEDSVATILSKIAPRVEVVECSLTVSGVPESSLAPELEAVARRHPRAYIKSHPKGHEVDKPVIEVRVLASGSTREEALEEARRALEEVRAAASRLGGGVGGESCPHAD